eukprot:Phypoly_transcript_24463.p1 GENE.Phypoly_transcript_24463~~Phypoly_transcript_24463.p1  ORF type:complete len:167 (+),score=32.87 Phypoly_transcript_24463:51-503(+)
MTKLLQILTVVMSTPGTKYESLLAAVIKFCLESVFPQLTGGSTHVSLDVRNQFYTLLPSLLQNHWKAAGNMHAAVIKALEFPFSSHDVGLFKQALDFLGGFLGSTTGLNDPQRHHLMTNFANDKDQPSFNGHITQFINDYRYFMNRNNPQ